MSASKLFVNLAKTVPTEELLNCTDKTQLKPMESSKSYMSKPEYRDQSTGSYSDIYDTT